MAAPRHEFDIALRAQALTLHALGVSRAEIKEKTGYSISGFTKLLRRAKRLGYTVGGPVLSKYVAGQVRPGRPKISTTKATRRNHHKMVPATKESCETSAQDSEVTKQGKGTNNVVLDQLYSQAMDGDTNCI